jgi:hypothetical protein
MLNFLHSSIVKNLLPVVKVQNGGYIQDGVENVYFFHPMIFLTIFFLFLFTLGKNKTFMEELILEKQMGGIL